MKILKLLIFFTILGSPLSYGQDAKSLKLKKCSEQWKYKTLNKSFTGELISFEQPVVMCGTVSTASVALIKTDKGKVIRVLTLCNIKSDFNAPPAYKRGEKVLATPIDKPKFRIDLMPIDSASCQIKIAYFALLNKVEQP